MFTLENKQSVLRALQNKREQSLLRIYNLYHRQQDSGQWAVTKKLFITLPQAKIIWQIETLVVYSIKRKMFEWTHYWSQPRVAPRCQQRQTEDTQGVFVCFSLQTMPEYARPSRTPYDSPSLQISPNMQCTPLRIRFPYPAITQNIYTSHVQGIRDELSLL